MYLDNPKISNRLNYSLAVDACNQVIEQQGNERDLVYKVDFISSEYTENPKTNKSLSKVDTEVWVDAPKFKKSIYLENRTITNILN